MERELFFIVTTRSMRGSGFGIRSMAQADLPAQMGSYTKECLLTVARLESAAFGFLTGEECKESGRG